MKSYKLIKTRQGVVYQIQSIETDSLFNAMIAMAIDGETAICVGDMGLTYSPSAKRYELKISSMNGKGEIEVLAKTI